MQSLTEKDRESICGTLDALDWETRQARLRGNEPLAFVYEEMAETLRRNVSGGADADHRAA